MKVNLDGVEVFGAGLDVGMKMKYTSMLNKMTEKTTSHVMAGPYVKPVIGCHIIGVENSTHSMFINTGLDFGRQFILNKNTAIDVFVGYHFIIGNSISSKDLLGYETFRPNRKVNTGDIYANGNHAVSFGVKIGFLYGSKQK